MLEEFYEQMQHVAVSATTGQGIDRLFDALETCRAQYEELYKPEVEAKRRVCVVLCEQMGMVVCGCTYVHRYGGVAHMVVFV